MIREEKGRKRLAAGYILLALWGIVFLASAFLLVKENRRAKEQKETFEGLRKMVETEGRLENLWRSDQGRSSSLALKDRILPESWKAEWEKEAKDRLAGYWVLKKENPDFAGWIRIVGTNLDYPVMLRQGQTDYYLYRDFYGKESSCGTPYLSEVCAYGLETTNFLISGHHMKDGSMFASLSNYREKWYFLSHPYVQFDRTDEVGSYEIAAVIQLDASKDSAICQNLLFPQKEEEFERAWEQVKRMGFYDTGVELSADDRLLALLTCEYSLSDGRLLLVARRIL
ncbi:class B sortase [Clostridiaceae bacterium]|nr:class B sortase [Clostridiaceae bacterium]